MGPVTELNPMETLQLVMQEINDMRRTVICPPHLVEQIEAIIAEQHLSGVITVKSSTLLPKGCMYILDDNALDAHINQSAQRGHQRIKQILEDLND